MREENRREERFASQDQRKWNSIDGNLVKTQAWNGEETRGGNLI